MHVSVISSPGHGLPMKLVVRLAETAIDIIQSTLETLIIALARSTPAIASLILYKHTCTLAHRYSKFRVSMFSSLPFELASRPISVRKNSSLISMTMLLSALDLLAKLQHALHNVLDVYGE